MVIPFCLNHNGQAITLDQGPARQGRQDAGADQAARRSRPKRSGHADDVRDDVPARHPRDVDALLARERRHQSRQGRSLITIPPPQMVANMKVGKMDGFCVGEPWNARAIADGIGFTAITTQQMWKDHPEKVLRVHGGVRRRRTRRRCGGDAAVPRGEPVHRQAREPPEVAEVVSRPQYINASKDDHPRPPARRLRLRRRPQARQDQLYMTFFDRETNFPLEVARRLVAHASSAAGAW